MNNSKHVTVKKEDLLSQIHFALRDYFVATFTQQSDELQVLFPNGQTFTLCVK